MSKNTMCKHMGHKGLLTALFLGLFLVPAIWPGDNALAQEDHDGLKYRKFRFTLVHPLGTNGIAATDYTARYSLNILAGYHGGLEGGEIGGLLNITRKNAEGIQLAGLGNISGDDTRGIQLSGVLNYSGQDMQGLQFTGGVNYARNTMQGILASGLANMSGYDMQGLIFAGAANISFGEMQGIMGSGLMNLAIGNMQGLMFAGGLNYSEEFQGIQAAAINASSHMEGIQAGLFNASGEVTGIQFGLFNYAEEMEGVPIGLISYYESGRRNVDVWGDEMGFTNIGLKLGTNQIYNMLSFGYNPALSGDVWQAGWTIGRHREYDGYWIDSDFSYHHINTKYWTNRINNRFSYRVLFGTELARHLEVYAGPTLNMLVSRTDDYSRFAPYSLYDASVRNRNYKFWLGATVGLQLFDAGESW